MSLEDSLVSIYKDVDQCESCEISQYPVNKRRSKLRGKEEPTELVFVAQNPSYWRKGDRDLYESQSGHYFIYLLDAVGIDRDRVFVTNLVKCSTYKNSRVLPMHIRNCRRFLEREIEVVYPKVIVPLGLIAQRFFGAMTGKWSTWRKYKVFGMYHPAHGARRRSPELDSINVEHLIAIKEELGW